MSELGSFVLLLALALSGYSFLAGLLALAKRQPGSERLGETARRAGIASFGAVFLAALVLVVSAFRNDFSIAYIFHHSNRSLPLPYKFAVLWSGQEGSLLFWSLLLSSYGLVLRLRYKTDERLFAHASVIIAAVQVFFLLLLNFAAKPFGIMQGTLPDDGSGLNPLLQYPEMVIGDSSPAGSSSARTGPIRCSAGAATGDGTRLRMRQSCPGSQVPLSCTR